MILEIDWYKKGSNTLIYDVWKIIVSLNKYYHDIT